MEAEEVAGGEVLAVGQLLYLPSVIGTGRVGWKGIGWDAGK